MAEQLHMFELPKPAGMIAELAEAQRNARRKTRPQTERRAARAHASCPACGSRLAVTIVLQAQT